MNAMIAKALGNFSLFWKAHGSTVCLVAGMTGAVGAGVLGAKGWHETKMLIDKKNEEMNRVNKMAEEKAMVTVDNVLREYTEEDKQKDIQKIQRSTIKGVAKAMGPAIGLGIGSLTLIGCGYGQVRGQLAGMTAYASSLETVIQQRDLMFRKELGDEKVDQLYAGYRTEMKEVVTEDPKTGEKKVTLEEQLVKELDIPTDNVFRFKFKRGCHEFRPGCREMNLSTLSIAQNCLTDLLVQRQYIYVEDIWDSLGTAPDDRSGIGQVCGKVYDPAKIPEENRVEFIYDPYEDPQSDEISFTVKLDGIILKRIQEVRKDYHPIRRRH